MTVDNKINVKIIIDNDEAIKKLDKTIERFYKLKRLSFWFILKMRLLGIHKHKKMITIQDLIEKDKEYKV